MIGRFFGVGSGAGRECSIVMVVVVWGAGGNVDIDREWVCRILQDVAGFPFSWWWATSCKVIRSWPALDLEA